MARFTGLDFVSFLRRMLGSPTTAEWSDEELLQLINIAQAEIASAEQPPELETSTTITTSSGTAEYELTATDVLQIIGITDTTNESTLYRIDRTEYESWTQGDYTATTGNPEFWFISGVGSNDRPQITFYPVPDGTYTLYVWYTKIPQEIVTTPTENSSEMRRQWDMLILKLAAAEGLSIMRQPNEAQSMRKEAYDLWNKLGRTRAKPTETVTLLESPIAKYTRRG